MSRILLALCLVFMPLCLMLFVTLPPPVRAAALPPVAAARAAQALPNATILVTNTNDSGVGSLRDAITQANASAGADTITFSVTGTIVRSSTLPSIADNLTIDGPGAPSLTISGNNAVGVIFVDTGVTLNLWKVTIANGMVTGDPGAGGGLYNNGGTVTISNTTFYSNSASNGGAASSTLARW